MGTKLKDITIKKEIEISDLKGKVLVVDSYNVMYQFLTTIRMADGSPLMDSKGKVTSHLVGTFSRLSNLISRYGEAAPSTTILAALTVPSSFATFSASMVTFRGRFQISASNSSNDG